MSEVVQSTFDNYRIMLFGSAAVSDIPEELILEIRKLASMGYGFMVGGRNGLDAAFHKELLLAGCKERTAVYSIGEPKSNKFDLPVRKFNTVYSKEEQRAMIVPEWTEANESNSVAIESVLNEEDIVKRGEFFTFIDRQMVKDCCFAICVWDGVTKGTISTIELLNIHNKQCFTYRMG